MNTILEFLSSEAMSEILHRAKDTVEELKELDAIISRLKANSHISDSDLASLAERSSAVASQYGKTAKDYLLTVQSLADAGAKNAGELAELSLALQSAGGVSAELANSYLLAADSAYQFDGSVEKLSAYLDGIHALSQSGALSLNSLAESMESVGSCAADAGLGIEESAAALAVLMSATGKSGADLTDSFRSIVSALGQATGDPMETLEQMALSYQSLSPEVFRQGRLFTSVGSKADTEALEALLANWNTYEQMLSDYQNGAGSLAVTAENTADTWEGSLNRLGNTWDDVIGTIADSETVTGSVNTLTELLSVIDKLTSSLGSFGAVSTLLSGALGAKGLGLTKLCYTS